MDAKSLHRPVVSGPVPEFVAMLWRQRRTCAVVCVAMLVALLVESFVRDPSYRSTLRMRVTSERPTVAAFAADVPEWLDPGTSQSKAVLVGSQAVLRGVVKQLKLDEKWSSRGGMPLTMDEALTQISRSVYVRPARERDILMIEASDANPALAIQIANAVFDEFQTQSVAGLRQQSDEALGRLREESVRQYRTMCDAQDLVLAARMRLDQTSVESALPQSMPRGTATATATALRERLDRIRAEIDDGRARLAVLRAMEAQGAAANANGLLHDEQANKLLDQTREVEQELSALSDRCGPNHPAVVKQALALNALRKQLGDRVSSCANGLEIELAARTQHLRAMEQQMMGGSDPSMRASTAGGPVAQLTQAYDNAVLEADLQTKVYQSLRDRLQRTSIEAQLPRPAAQAIERPIQATLDTSRRLCDMPMIAVGLTLLFAAIAARIADSLDVGVRSGAAAGSILAAPLLATLRQRPRMLDDQHVTVEEIEAFRMVVARMRFLDPESRMRTLAVVSGERGEGRSSTVANLACLFAAQGQRVLVVDTDLNSASMHERFDVTPVPGLVDFLENSAALDDVIAPSNMSNVWLTPAGTPGAKTSPTPLHIAALTRQAQSRFDMVIYDTAPLSEASDAAIVAREAQHALFVVRAGRSTQPALASAAELLAQAACSIVGVIYNESRTPTTVSLRTKSAPTPPHYSIARLKVMQDRVQAHEQARQQRSEAA